MFLLFKFKQLTSSSSSSITRISFILTITIIILSLTCNRLFCLAERQKIIVSKLPCAFIGPTCKNTIHSSRQTLTKNTIKNNNNLQRLDATVLYTNKNNKGDNDRGRDDNGENNTADDNLLKWERMYEEGKLKDSKSIFKSNEEEGDDDEILKLLEASEVRVISFDLDNTLWNTTTTINAANDAVADYISSLGNVQQPKRIEKIMQELFKQNKYIYNPIEATEKKDTDLIKGPVLLTKLRKDAINHLLNEYNDDLYNSEQERNDFVDTVFDVWMNARYSSIAQNYASNVLQCLQELASSITTSSGDKVVICAITDGNSDPRNLPELAEYFDFVVQAESIGIAKPDRRVYIQAVREVLESGNLPHITRPNDIQDDDAIENIIGPYWVHIGDDFVKDIVAAKSLRMRTVWATELIQDKLQKEAEKPKKPTKSVEEFVKEISAKKVISMAIGADSYLADTLQNEFVDATAEKFDTVSAVILDWHKLGLERSASFKDPTATTNAASTLPSSPPLPPPPEVEPVATTPKTETPVTKAQPESKTSKNIIDSPATLDDADADADADLNPLTVVLPDKAPADKTSRRDVEIQSIKMQERPRAFRLVRDQCTMDVPAPRKNRPEISMKDILQMAQIDKSSGVFSFPPEDVEAMKAGKKVLMIKVGDLEFTREVFVTMTAEDVLALADTNPLQLTLFMKDTVEQPGFDLF